MTNCILWEIKAAYEFPGQGVGHSPSLIFPRVVDSFDVPVTLYFSSIVSFDTVFLLTLSIAAVHYLTFWYCVNGINRAFVVNANWASSSKNLSGGTDYILYLATNRCTMTKIRCLMSESCPGSSSMRSHNDSILCIKVTCFKAPVIVLRNTVCCV